MLFSIITRRLQLEQATDYEDRKRIRGALRVLRKKQTGKSIQENHRPVLDLAKS